MSKLKQGTGRSEKEEDYRCGESKSERLQKLLSAYGAASRRGAEKLILEGRVQINGVTAELGQSAFPGQDNITVDGVPLESKVRPVYIMLNKPCGYITTRNDERGRKTVMELVSGVPGYIYPVGRLDKDSEGLLLFTNDGEFANTVLHPSFNNQKTYEVKVRGDAQKAEELLQQPVKIDNYTVYASKVVLLEAGKDGGTLEISVTEGRNRQIRKMCAACGTSVITLKRKSVGRLELGDLETGQWRYLTEEEVLSFG